MQPLALDRRFKRHLAATACLLLAGCGRADPGSDASPPANTAGRTVVAIARGTIDVDGGLVRVAAARDGVVASLNVEEGDSVSVGQVLLRLDPRVARQSLSLARSEAEVASTLTQVAEARRAAAEAVAQRSAAAAHQGVGTDAAAADAGAALAQARMDAEVARTQAALARVRVAAAEADLASYDLVAPVAGRIVRRNVGVGEAVQVASAEGIVQIAPSRPLIARIEVDEEVAQRIQAGATVELASEFDDSHHWNGRIRRVADVYGRRTPTDTPGEKQDQHVLVCIVELDGSVDVRIGQRVIARVLQ